MPISLLRDAATAGGARSGPGAAARASGLKRPCGTLRCCQITLPKAQADIKASPAELATIARFLHHYSNGSVRRIAGDLAPGVLMLDPFYAAAHSQLVLSGLEEIDHQRRFDSALPPDMSLNILSAVTESESHSGDKHVYISFTVTNPFSAVWERFLTTLLALPRRSDDIGLLRFTLTSPHGLISEVACLKKPTRQLRSMQNRHVDSYNLHSLSDCSAKHPALVLLERM